MTNKEPPVYQSDLISSGRFIMLYASLAQKIGLNEAIIVQQLYFLLSLPGGKELNGHHWVYNTYEKWQKDHFPFWSIATIQRIFSNLESMLIVESCQPDKGLSRKKYYRLNQGMLTKLLKGSLPVQKHQIANDSPSYQNDTMDRIKLIRSITYKTDIQSKESLPSESGAKTRKASKKTKLLLLEKVTVPDGIPTQEEFNSYLGDSLLEHLLNLRPDIYADFLETKWHSWNNRAGMWVPIRDWRAYVTALNSKIGERSL